MPEKKYIKLNGKYLSDAEVLLQAEDYPQASEKLWGAATQIVKAIAVKRGKALRSHEALFKFVETLADELKDDSIISLFHVASSLHQNFYEDWFPPKTVLRGAGDVKKFVKKLIPLLGLPISEKR